MHNWHIFTNFEALLESAVMIPFKLSPTSLRRIGISAAVAAGILLAEYLLSNWVGHVFDDTSLLSAVNTVLPFKNNAAPADEGVVYFNVGYDKQLVAVRDEFGDSIGSTVITDRRVLLKLLEIARQADYRYLFLDIRFEKDTSTPADSLLFSRLLAMPRVVISTHSNMEPASEELQAKTGLADYVSTYFSGFTKYGYLQGDSASVALKMFREIDGGDVRRVGPLFVSDGVLCNNLQFLTFTESDLEKTCTPAFGGEYLRLLSPEQLAALMDGKIVAVGDMAGDVHSTYIGDISGPVLNILAYEALRAGRHHVGLGLVIFLFVAYALFSYIILYVRSLESFPKLSGIVHRHPLLGFGTFLLGWGFVLLVLKILVFLIFRYSLIIAVPSVVFSLLSMPSDYGDFKSKL